MQKGYPEDISLEPTISYIVIDTSYLVLLK